MGNPLLLPDIRLMLVEDDRESIAALLDFHPATAADFIEDLDAEETWQLLEYATPQQRAGLFAFLPVEKQIAMVHGAGKEHVARLLESMAHDDRVQLLRQLDEDLVDSLLPLVAQADREDIRKLLSYPEHSAGSIMTTEYASLSPNMTVAQAISSLRHQADHSETLYYLYVLDSDRHVLGFVSLHDLILAKPNTLIEELMVEHPVRVPVEMDQEEVAKILSRYDFLAVPVVDPENRLVGIVTHDDVMDVLEEEHTEDAQRMASIVPFDEHYLDAPFITVWRKRSVWLSCLFLAELFTFSALAHYEDAIASIIALSLFVPLCISTGGNSGSQAATLITRAMALGQVSPSHWWRVFRHELVMGTALGLTLGGIGFLRASMTPASILGNADRWTLAWVIGQAVFGICLWGTVVGSMLPLIFKRLGVDPGYASSPFVATFVDVTGIIIYFSIASAYLL